MWFLYSLYNCLLYLFLAGFKVLGVFNSKVSNLCKDRKFDAKKIQNIIEKRKNKKYCVLYYCSSAGEFEQALPIIERLSSKKDIFQLVVFFSQSGINYYHSTGQSIPYIKSFFDFKNDWEKFFDHLEVNLTVIVRHEIWPNFLKAASKKGKVFLVNASIDLVRNQNKRFKLRLLKHLYSKMDNIYAVNEEQVVAFRSLFDLRVTECKDSKYDRVNDRLNQKKDSPSSLLLSLQSHSKNGRKILVVGSAWPSDVELVLNAFASLDQTDLRDWGIVIAPHEIDEAMTAKVKDICAKYMFSPITFSQYSEALIEREVLIVNKLGYLAELYSLASLAWVGGGLDKKVHNVLEPAIYGVPICIGPNYKNSEEAKFLVKHNGATVISCFIEFKRLAEGLTDAELSLKKNQVHRLMEKMLGGSKQIAEDIVNFLYKA